jgi:hypothetical protein
MLMDDAFQCQKLVTDVHPFFICKSDIWSPTYKRTLCMSSTMLIDSAQICYKPIIDEHMTLNGQRHAIIHVWYGCHALINIMLTISMLCIMIQS